MKISHKLILSFLLVATLASAAVIFTVRSHNKIDQTFDKLMVDSTPTVKVLNRLKASGSRIVSSTSEVDLKGGNSRDEMQNLELLHTEGYNEFTSQIAAYGEIVRTVTPEDANFQELIRAIGQNLVTTSTEIVELKKKGIAGPELRSKTDEFERYERTFFKYIDQALEFEYGEEMDDQNNVHELIAQSTRQSWTAALLTFMLAIFSGIYISFLFSKRIYKLKDATEKVGAGDLDTKIEITSSDEIADLSRSFNTMIGNLRDTRTEITTSRNFMDSVIGSIADVLIVLDMDLKIVRVNETAVSLTKYSRADLTGGPIELLHPDENLFDERFLSELHKRGSISGRENYLQTQLGIKVPVLFSASIMKGADGEGIGIVCLAQDISKLKSLESQLTHQALHDPLTRLANRVLFRDRVEHAINRVARKGSPVAVLFLDLDNFKTVNDSLGHAAGDELLLCATERLQTCLRSFDTAARLGGDEFAVLVEDISTAEDAERVAERIRAVFSVPFTVAGAEVYVTTSIGIASTVNGSETPEELLRNADVAMYTSKKEGKNRATVFEGRMHEDLVKRVRLESDMRMALKDEEFEVYYQPIMDLQSERIMGMEALVRWNHPRFGLVAPLDFIPLAEETGLIVPLGKWILETACRQAAAWQGKYGATLDLSITVNISNRQFQDIGFSKVVDDALILTGLNPGTLILEITETTMLDETEAAITKLRDLKKLGLRLAIDDFGTGYSSLSYLQRFPVDILKIDKAFIDKIASGKEGSAVAKAIIMMSETLSMKTVAEGIESASQQAELQKLGCEFGQGYHFAKPLRVGDMDDFIGNAVRTTDDPSMLVAGAGAMQDRDLPQIRPS